MSIPFAFSSSAILRSDVPPVNPGITPMTVSTSYAPITYTGNGSTTAFPVTWPFYTGSLVVTEVVIATGAETVKTISTHYTVSGGTAASGTPSTGTVTAMTAPASTVQWRITRVTPKVQGDVFTEGDAFPPKTVESALDRVTLIAQETAYATALIELPSFSGNAGKALIANDDEDGLEFFSLSGVDLDIGTVTTLAAGQDATAEITGTAPDFTLNLGIPRGNTGASGNGTGDMLAAENLGDVADAATAFGNIKQAASTSATGVVELATDAEAAGVGADTSRYIVPAQLHESAADVASATTCDIGAAASNFVRITGTTTITGLGTVAAGTWRWVYFADALTLTHNGTSLILPGAANITTAANDRMFARSLGSGNWLIFEYVKASGLPLVVATVAEAGLGTNATKPVTPAGLFPPSENLASASTVDMGATTGGLVIITGTTTIASFGTAAAGIRRRCFINTGLTLTYSSQLVMPTGTHIVAAANDTFEAFSLGSGNWEIIWYQRWSGAALTSSGSAGKLISRNYTSYATNANLIESIPIDDTIPQSSEGTQVMSATITPASSSNRVRITVAGFGAATDGSTTPAGGAIVAALFKDSDTGALYASASQGPTNVAPTSFSFVFEHAPSTTSTITYKLRVGSQAGPGFRLNGTNAARLFGGVAAATMVLEEIAP